MEVRFGFEPAALIKGDHHEVEAHLLQASREFFGVLLIPNRHLLVVAHERLREVVAARAEASQQGFPVHPGHHHPVFSPPRGPILTPRLSQPVSGLRVVDAGRRSGCIRRQGGERGEEPSGHA